MAGAVFGEVGVSLFVAGAAFGDILGDSRSAKCCIFQYKIVSEIGRVRSPKRRVRDDDFISSDYPRIILGMSSNRLSIGGSNSESVQCNLELKDFVAGAVFGELAPRIGNDVSYVTRINHEIHFAWQAQYLVNLSFDVCCSAHCK